MKQSLFVIFFLITSCIVIAQEAIDTLNSKRAESITVQALYSNAQWKETPVAIVILNRTTLQNLTNQSLLPAFNAISGVRLEERSPGSLRLSIRGSLLRSPFGVRNIKVYWNNLPLSDGGGNTYFNLLELQNIQRIEVIKGPAASVYGAGTGGVVLVQSNLPFTNKKTSSIEAGLTTGSFGLISQHVQLKFQHKNIAMQLLQSHVESNGYRQQSALNKNTFQYNISFKQKKHLVEVSAFYTSLNYQTPGGITLEQMLLNPTLARQATATLPSAIQQKTAVYNNTFFGGLNHNFTINNELELNTGLAFGRTDFKNPFITNYEMRNEKNTAIQSKLIYSKRCNQLQLKWITGFEYLMNNSSIQNYTNKNGVADSLLLNDAVKANQWFVFSQFNINYKKWNLQIGVSANEQWYGYERLNTVNTNSKKESSTKMITTPRVAISYKINKNISLYSIAAKGFSPPTLAEVKPSDGNFYSNLQAEYGWNFEAGVKGNLLNNKLQFDIALYHFKLNNAIVRRNNLAGEEYFINSGQTLQKGIETSIQYKVFSSKTTFIQSIQLNNSNSFQPYAFTNYVVGNNDFSGNALTGVPTNIHVTSIDVLFKNKLQCFIQYNYTSSIPLTDANDAFATDYRLMQTKFIYPIQSSAWYMNVFFGIDNLLNEQYSLGNDINAAGRRFYNPAPTRNFFTGINIRFN